MRFSSHFGNELTIKEKNNYNFIVYLELGLLFVGRNFHKMN